MNEEAGVNTNEIQSLFTEIIKENFPSIGKGNDIHMYETHQNRSTPRHIKIKVPEIHYKNRITQAVREKR